MNAAKLCLPMHRKNSRSGIIPEREFKVIAAAAKHAMKA
jgi:hypothetical protein